MFPSVFAFRSKRTSLMSVLTHLHRAGRRAFMVYWCFRTFTPPYYFSTTHTFFHFVLVIYTHSPPCPLRVLALRPLDASSSTLFLFLVSATIKNTIRVLSLEVGWSLILKLKILTLERYLLKIKCFKYSGCSHERKKVHITGAGCLRKCKNTEFVWELRKMGVCEGGSK